VIDVRLGFGRWVFGRDAASCGDDVDRAFAKHSRFGALAGLSVGFIFSVHVCKKDHLKSVEQPLLCL